MQQTSLRNFWVRVLMAAIVLVVSSCAGSETSTVASDTTVPADASQEAGDAPSNSGSAPAPTLPPGDSSVVLGWVEAGISGETFTDQLLVTYKGLIAYRFAHEPVAWVSEDGIDWTSADGFVWTRHELSLNYPDLGVFASILLGPVVGGPDGLLLIGRMDRGEGGPDEHRFLVWTSDDGSEWTLVADAFPDGAYVGDILPTREGSWSRGSRSGAI